MAASKRCHDDDPGYQIATSRDPENRHWPLFPANVVQNPMDEKTLAQHRPINPIGIQKGRQQYVPGRPSNEREVTKRAHQYQLSLFKTVVIDSFKLLDFEDIRRTILTAQYHT